MFAGSFELEAAEDICGGDVGPEDVDDLLTALVDKSILIRAESTGPVRFRLLETLRDYGREKIKATSEYPELRRRHLGWYQRLARAAADEWFSARQIDWIKRLDQEMPNLREAVEFSLTNSPEAAAGMAAELSPFWISHGLVGEGRRWLDQALARTPPEPTYERVEAIYYASVLASLQGDVHKAAARAREAQEVAEQLAGQLSRPSGARACCHRRRVRRNVRAATPIAHAGASTRPSMHAATSPFVPLHSCCSHGRTKYEGTPQKRSHGIKKCTPWRNHTANRCIAHGRYWA